MDTISKIIIILSLILLPSINLYAESYDDFIKKAFENMEEKNFLTAHKYFLLAEENADGKSDAEYQSSLGQFAALANLGKSKKDEARVLFKKIIKKFGENDLLFYNLGLLELYSSRNKAAIEAFDKAIELNPKNADHYWNRGTAYDHLGKWNNAISDYNEGLKIDPNHADIYNNRGKTFLDMQNYEKAIQDLNKALEVNPEHKNAQALLEKALEKQREMPACGN